MTRRSAVISCPDGCGESELCWATNHKGSKMIFEITPNPRGKWILEGDDPDFTVRIADRNEPGDRWICHWDRCPMKGPRENASPTHNASPTSPPGRHDFAFITIKIGTSTYAGKLPLVGATAPPPPVEDEKAAY